MTVERYKLILTRSMNGVRGGNWILMQKIPYDGARQKQKKARMELQDGT